MQYRYFLSKSVCSGLRVRLLTAFMFIVSVSNMANPLEIYSSHGYEITHSLQRLVVSYPYVHALIEALYVQSDSFYIALMNLVYMSQSYENEQDNLIKVESHLARTVCYDRTLNYYKEHLYSRQWWLEGRYSHLTSGSR